MMPYLTRVRVEGACLPSHGKRALETFLVDEATKIRNEQGGSWIEEDPPVVQSAKTGWWGRYTIKRETHDSSQ